MSNQIEISEYHEFSPLISPPLLAFFPSGPPLSTLQNPEQDLKFSVYETKSKSTVDDSSSKKRKRESTHNKYFMKVETPIIEYSSYFNDNSNLQGYKYLVGLYDSETNKVKLVETLPLVNLSPHFKLEKSTSSLTENEGATDPSTRYEATKNLIGSFGSNMKKRIYRSKLASTITEEQVSNVSMDSMQDLITDQSKKFVFEKNSNEIKTISI